AREAAHEALATEEDARQLKAIAIVPLKVCIDELSAEEPKSATEHERAAALTKVEAQVKAIAAGVMVIANSK
ncbi:hypothetical protein ACQ7B2_10910, partial [Escherichia coli]